VFYASSLHPLIIQFETGQFHLYDNQCILIVTFPFPLNSSEYSGQTGFFVTFGEISYLLSNKKNRNDQEPELIFTGNFIEKCVIDKYKGLI
jgi:hypothetical protein